MPTTMQEFYQELLEGKFVQALVTGNFLLLAKKIESDFIVSDTENTIFHAFILGCIKKIEDFVLDKNQYDITLNDSVKNLLKFLVENNFTLKTPNNNKKLPLELFIEQKEKFIDNTSSLEKISNLEEKLIKLFDITGTLLVHGPKYVDSLALEFSSKTATKTCSIPDAWPNFPFLQNELQLTLHQRLFLCGTYLKKNFYSDQQSQNVVVANIGFVISDGEKRIKGGKHTRKFITLPLDDKDNIALTKDLSTAIQKDYESKNKNSTHSEIGLIQYLLKDNTVEKIVEDLIQHINKHSLEKHQAGHKKIYAVILDMNSTRRVCEYCIISLIKLQKEYTENSFMYKLQQKLTNKGFLVPTKPLIVNSAAQLKLTIRASGLDEFSLWSVAQERGKQHIQPISLETPYPSNIKQHAIGTFFHLTTPTVTAGGDLYKKRQEATSSKILETIKIITKKGFFEFHLQTGFATLPLSPGTGIILRTQPSENEAIQKKQTTIQDMQYLIKVLEL